MAEAALDQLPTAVVEQSDILLRCDSAGATHDLLDSAKEGGHPLLGWPRLTEAVREAILGLGPRP